jgi:hypothetical protein
MTKIILPLALSIAAIAAAAALKFDAPAGWASKTPSSSMRLAEFTLPKSRAIRKMER